MELRHMDLAEIERAAAVLRAGGLALLPSETVYGVYAAASGSGVGVAALRALSREPEVKARTYPWTWHAASRERVEEALPLKSPLHRRVARVFLPGPVRLHVERTDEQIRATLDALRVAPGIIDGEFVEAPGRVISVRVPDHEATRDVLTRAGGAAIAESAANFGLGDGQVMTEASVQRAMEIGIGAALVDQPARFGRASTAIRLLAGGGYRIMSVGAIDEREVRARVERRVVFVCSGNTCRSPVAEAIARHLLSNRPHAPGEAPVPVRVSSAGTSASVGMAMTPESAEALTEMDIDPGRHTSRQLQQEELAGADLVFVMTKQHRRVVEMMMGQRGTPIQLLDPDGADIDDPIGGPLRQYREMAKTVRRAIERRLAEIEEGDRR
ncbi:MAG: Sua5/YciO/YrdC/YwlC family protein [Phycisphaerales bacterium]|jgi:protein-tyrosine phosphatase